MARKRNKVSIKCLNIERNVRRALCGVDECQCTDGMGLSFWSRPEAVLDRGARRATSGFARMDDDEEQAIVDRLSADLASGAWDERHGHLRLLSELDVGLRLLVVELG